MTTSFAPALSVGSPSRVITSTVMVPRRRDRDLGADDDPQSFLRKICGRMRPHDSPRRHKICERRQQSVLLVEDDPCNRELIQDIFRYDGIPANLVTATTAEESLAEVSSLMPMLILMDLKLPGMDGIEAIRLLKKSSATEHIPIWAVTCLNHREDIERGLEAGCDGYITKPIRRSEFVFRLLSLWEDPINRDAGQIDFNEEPGSDFWLS